MWLIDTFCVVELSSFVSIYRCTFIIHYYYTIFINMQMIPHPFQILSYLHIDYERIHHTKKQRNVYIRCTNCIQTKMSSDNDKILTYIRIRNYPILYRMCNDMQTLIYCYIRIYVYMKVQRLPNIKGIYKALPMYRTEFGLWWFHQFTFYIWYRSLREGKSLGTHITAYDVSRPPHKHTSHHPIRSFRF